MTHDPYAPDGRTNRQRMLDGDFYIADDPELARITSRAQRLTDLHARAFATDPDIATMILRECLGALGEGAEIRPRLTVDYGENIFVGDRTFINFGLVALDVARISIGADCQIGPNVQLLTPIHPVEPGPRRDRWESAKPIRIGDNVWLGGGVVVCPGVTIGSDSVIGAGAVVTKDVPPRSVAVGNPARVVRRIDEDGAARPKGE
ncbi:sugar O-acetyltransferase [Actinomyces culturomici]|uniref:sugar O-acetyltransferase n=1 Tax=Actinomyces culturomici TaxID=1926276 RepID=UPI000E1FF8B8|nr:sugar O-acetyltransferase [Actinomyces culturomici]